MNDHDVISRLSTLPDEGMSVYVDVDTVIASVKVQRKRRRAVGATVLATAALVAGLVVATGQLDRDTATPAAQPGTWAVNSPDIKDADLAIAPISQSDVWAVGYERSPRKGELAMHWDGTGWKRFDVPAGHALFDVAAVASNDIWAVGRSDDKPAAAHWNGTSWQAVPVPTRGRERSLVAVAAVSADDVWAIGSTDDKNGRPFIVHWDGRAWQEVTAPAIPGATGILLRDITAMAADDVWVVGISNAGDGRQPLSLHWDGHQWSVIPVPEPAADMSAIAALESDDVWAVGGDRFFHWDGSRWQGGSVPAELNADLLTLAPDGVGGLLAAGRTRKCETESCPTGDGGQVLVARWNGSEWTQLKPPADGVGLIMELSATPGTGVVWATGDVVRPTSGVDVTGKPVTEEWVSIVASIFFAQ